jgi:hypothetical protein
MIAELAAEKGKILERTDHPRLPFMGPDGCVLEPYQRPICAVHVCEPHLYKPDGFYEEYMRLRQAISEKEWELEEQFECTSGDGVYRDQDT